MKVSWSEVALTGWWQLCRSFSLIPGRKFLRIALQASKNSIAKNAEISALKDKKCRFKVCVDTKV
jgi:hypothetical protein